MRSLDIIVWLSVTAFMVHEFEEIVLTSRNPHWKPKVSLNQPSNGSTRSNGVHTIKGHAIRHVDLDLSFEIRLGMCTTYRPLPISKLNFWCHSFDAVPR